MNPCICSRTSVYVTRSNWQDYSNVFLNMRRLRLIEKFFEFFAQFSARSAKSAPTYFGAKVLKEKSCVAIENSLNMVNKSSSLFFL